MIVFDIPKVILQSREKVKIFNFLILTMSGPYGLYMYALETCVCCGDMIYAVWTCYMLYGHVFLLEKNIWLWKMSSCWRRIYSYFILILINVVFIFSLTRAKSVRLVQLSNKWRRNAVGAEDPQRIVSAICLVALLDHSMWCLFLFFFFLFLCCCFTLFKVPSGLTQAPSFWNKI